MSIDITTSNKAYGTLVANLTSWQKVDQLPLRRVRRITFTARKDEENNYSVQQPMDMFHFIMEIAKLAKGNLKHVGFVGAWAPGFSQRLISKTEPWEKIKPISIALRLQTGDLAGVLCSWERCDTLLTDMDLFSLLFHDGMSETNGRIIRLGCHIPYKRFISEISYQRAPFAPLDSGIFAVLSEILPKLEWLILLADHFDLEDVKISANYRDLAAQRAAFVCHLPDMEAVRRLSVQIYGLYIYGQVYGNVPDKVQDTAEYFTKDVCEWYVKLAVQLLESHQNLDVAFVTIEGPFYAAAKRENGYIFSMRGFLGNYSRYRFPLGLLDDECLFPAHLKIPENHPLSEVVYLNDD